MSTLVTLSQSIYDQRKAEALQTSLLRKSVMLSEMKMVSADSVEISGVTIKLGDFAIKRLLSRLRIPKAFANRFKDGFGEEGLKSLIEMMKTAKVSDRDQEVTILLDPVEMAIVDVLPKNYASIDNEVFLNYIEDYISGFNLDVTHFGSNARNGEIIINAVSNKSIYKIPGLDSEVFNGGVTFKNTPTHGIQVTPYLNRLICANGLSTTAFSENLSLHSLGEKHIKEFNEHMIMLASTGFLPSGLTDMIKKATYTDASLSELQYAASAILTAEKGIDSDVVQKYAPINRAMKAYELLGAEPQSFNKKQMMSAKSGVSIYDVINGMTNFASNHLSAKLNDTNRVRVMMKAGDLLTKKQFDIENYVNIDPFANGRKLLSDSELNSLRGNQ